MDHNKGTDSEDDIGKKPSTLKSPAKKVKRMCKFRAEWLETFGWLAKGSSELYARCKLCNKDFSISHGGITDVKHHDAGVEHKRRITAGKSNAVLQNFFPKQNSLESDKITFAELATTFHCVKHNMSYNSIDCSNKLLPQLFTDSNIAKKISCGKTKCESIVKEVLGPLAEEVALDSLKSSTSEKKNNDMYFSIMTDTSNKGNRKMYPICVQYFSFDKGCQNKLLDFFECSSETSNAICENILNTLGKFGLDIANVVAFSADNTNANFGVNRSAYTLLKEKNPNLVKAGCLAHVLNNTFKYAMHKLDFDIEGVVLKIYNHFQCSSLRREELKEFVEQAEIGWKELNKHVPTRWLSFGPAIDKILKVFPAIMAYFVSLGEDCPSALRSLLCLDGLYAEHDIGYLEYSKTSLYLHFCSNVCSVFEKPNMALQSSSTTATELFSIMETVKGKLCSRKDEKFFGAHMRLSRNHADEHFYNEAIADFEKFYDNAILYLEKHFEFNGENTLQKISPLSLRRGISYNQVVEAVTSMGINKHISLDELFDEFSVIKPILPVVVSSSDFTVEQKWVSLFHNVKEEKLPQLRFIVSCALSIPPSNAYVERVFSNMSLKWTNIRNRGSVDLIRAELLITLNLDMSCADFISTYKNNKKLINATRSNEKYVFKKR